MKLRDKAYNRFTDKLLSRALLPGQFVSQRELVKITQLPLGAIREMVPRLEADGLIVTAPQRGLQIAHIDLNLIKNAFQFRLFLEKQAAETFAREGTDEEFRRLRLAHEVVLDAASIEITQDLIEQAQAVDWNLHETIIDSLNNKIISNAYRVNFVKIRLIRLAQTSLNPETVSRSLTQHLEIIDKFEQRDAVAAGQTMEAHIQAARARALGV